MTSLRLRGFVCALACLLARVDSVPDMGVDVNVDVDVDMDVDGDILPRLWGELHGSECRNEATVEALLRAAKRSNLLLEPFLFESADAGYLHCVKVLLDHGANLEARNEFGHTPLVLARLGRHDAVEALVLERLRARPTWHVSLSSESLATWMQHHSGVIEKFVRSGTGEGMTDEEVLRHFPELAVAERAVILGRSHAESARYAEERGSIHGPL